MTKKEWKITWTHEGTTTEESVPINTIRLRPLNFEKDHIPTDAETLYDRCKVAEGEEKLLDSSCNHFLNWN